MYLLSAYYHLIPPLSHIFSLLQHLLWASAFCEKPWSHVCNGCAQESRERTV